MYWNGSNRPAPMLFRSMCSNFLVGACLPLKWCTTVTRNCFQCRLFNTRSHVFLLTCVCCANLCVDFFGLCVILWRMSSITSGVRTAGALCFGALCTDPVARQFLTNVCRALFAGMHLPWKFSPKIPRVP
jgi:hypothetical protein